MNTVVTSKEEILRASRELIRQKGWDAVNIRSVAAACGVSVGSIYNYFDSKAALVGAAVESVWCEIFHRPEDEAVFEKAASSTPAFSPSTPWAFCGRTSPTASGGWSAPGSTSARGCWRC